jgi:hypothetical protein
MSTLSLKLIGNNPNRRRNNGSVVVVQECKQRRFHRRMAINSQSKAGTQGDSAYPVCSECN